MAIPADDEQTDFTDTSSLAAVFHALAEPTRLAILAHLATDEHRVRDLVDHMHLAQSTVSKHLSCLRDCGLVKVRPEGRSSWFSLTDSRSLAAVLDQARALTRADGARTGIHDHDALTEVI